MSTLSADALSAVTLWRQGQTCIVAWVLVPAGIPVASAATMLSHPLPAAAFND